LAPVTVYRDFGVSERSAAFTPLPLGTLCVADFPERREREYGEAA